MANLWRDLDEVETDRWIWRQRTAKRRQSINAGEVARSAPVSMWPRNQLTRSDARHHAQFSGTDPAAARLLVAAGLRDSATLRRGNGRRHVPPGHHAARALGPKPWRAAYVQPSRRPTDGRYGENPNRLQHYYQYQVIMKPSPEDAQDLLLGSYRELGLDPLLHDFRFVEDDWESPTSAPGASAGRCGATAWRWASSPTSSRSAASR